MGFIDWYIQRLYVYLDQKSEEKSTKKTNPKYKVYIKKHPIFKEVLIFFILTSQNHYPNKKTIISIQSSEWEQHTCAKLNKTSYIDIIKPSHLNSTEIETKYNDQNNGFVCVAKLPDNRFQEMQSKIQLIKSYDCNDQLKKDNISTAVYALEKDENIKDKLRELGLS